MNPKSILLEWTCESEDGEEEGRYEKGTEGVTLFKVPFYRVTKMTSASIKCGSKEKHFILTQARTSLHDWVMCDESGHECERRLATLKGGDAIAGSGRR